MPKLDFIINLCWSEIAKLRKLDQCTATTERMFSVCLPHRTAVRLSVSLIWYSLSASPSLCLPLTVSLSLSLTLMVGCETVPVPRYLRIVEGGGGGVSVSFVRMSFCQSNLSFNFSLSLSLLRICRLKYYATVRLTQSWLITMLPSCSPVGRESDSLMAPT